MPETSLTDVPPGCRLSVSINSHLREEDVLLEDRQTGRRAAISIRGSAKEEQWGGEVGPGRYCPQPLSEQPAPGEVLERATKCQVSAFRKPNTIFIS